jgi:tetratricopeptide (TPR) repeat protein
VGVPLLDGTRSVRELIETAGLDEFETGKAVYGLIQAGFAHRVGTRETAAAPKSPEDELAERRNLATAFFRTRMFTEARQQYDAILALTPDDLAARFRLGLIAVLEGRHRSAVRAFKAVLERGGPRYGAFIGLAGALRGLGRHADALLVLDEAEALRPGGADVPLARGMSRLELGEIAAARADFATYAERLPDDVEPAPAYFYFAALAAALHGARDDARALTTHGLRGRPDASPLLLMMGLLEERAGDDARAAHWYGRAVAEDAACAHAHRGLGDIAQRASRPRHALAHYRRALEADADLGSDVHTRIGNLLYNMGDFTGAVRHWNRALELDPADEAVRNNLEIVSHAAR